MRLFIKEFDRAIGYIKHLFYSIRLEEFSNARVFHIKSIFGSEYQIPVPYDYYATIKLNSASCEGFKINIHRTLLQSYQNKIYDETRILFPINFFDTIVTNRILSLHYKGVVYEKR